MIQQPRLRSVLLAWGALGFVGCGDESPATTQLAECEADGGAAGGAGELPGEAGSGGSSPSSPPEVECPEISGPIDPTAMVDDLEDKDGALPMVRPFAASWWVAADSTEGTIDPPADAMPTPTQILGGRCGSEYAMRITGNGFSDWGSELIATLAWDGVVTTVDASRFQGVTFWARVGDTHTSPVRFQIQDRNSYDLGGVCDPEPGSEQACFDAFGTELSELDGTWRFFKLPFNELTQVGYGYPADALDTSHLYIFEWAFQPGSTFDLWVDDVFFYE